ncbi:MAG: DUF1643 domain-containing protein [Cytophagales bacterium]|nr:DUF1643 domain-containing protein [Armatimonadota bacterium]
MHYTIYANTEDNLGRFALGMAGASPLFIFGVNPSTASQLVPDRTMRKAERFALLRGDKGYVMLNVYPLRSTCPDDLPSVLDENLHRRNLDTIRQHLQRVRNPVLWAAWGDPVEKRPYLLDCLTDIHEATKHYSPEWNHCGDLTRSGNPRHPSRLAYASVWEPFDLPRYLRGKDTTRGMPPRKETP